MGNECSFSKTGISSLIPAQKKSSKLPLQHSHTSTDFLTTLSDQKPVLSPKLAMKTRSFSANSNIYILAHSINCSDSPLSVKYRETKAFTIVADNGSKINILIKLSEQENLTCEWLVGEAMKKLAEHNLLKLDPNRPIVALQTLDKHIALDYWLSIPGRSISKLKDGLVLRPFYGDNKYNLKLNNI